MNLHLLPACSLWAGELEPGNSPLIGGDINVASRLLGGRGSSTLLWSVGDSIREEENQTARKDAALFSKSSMLAPSPCLEARGSDHSVSSDERTRSVHSKPLEVKESSLSTAANRRDRITNERVSSSETDFEDVVNPSLLVLPGLHLVSNRSGSSFLSGAGVQSVDPVESMAKSEVAVCTEGVRKPSPLLSSPQQMKLGELCSPCSHMYQNNSALSDGSWGARDYITIESDAPTVSDCRITPLKKPIVHVVSSSEEDTTASMRTIDKDSEVRVHHSLSMDDSLSTFTVPEVVSVSEHTETEVANVDDSSSSEENVPEFSLVTNLPQPTHLENAEARSLVGVRRGSLFHEKPPPMPMLSNTPSLGRPLFGNCLGETDVQEQVNASSGIIEDCTCSISADRDSSNLEDSRIDEGIGLESSSDDVMIVGVEGGRVRLQDEQIISVLTGKENRI